MRARYVQFVTWTAVVLMTWFIMGLWHGAAWLFALWGIYHAILLICYRFIPVLGRLPERYPLAAWLLMLFLAMAGWIPFRARSLDQAASMFFKILNPGQYTLSNRLLDGYAYIGVVVLLVGMSLIYFLHTSRPKNLATRLIEPPVFAVAITVMVILIIVRMRPVTQFVYFQF